ncbi:MAG: PepSY-like domain-containing protein [Bacteroidales bacterium]|jgi:hypothetical protein|nr:PepSY-like domain-containing protein [Bacteroidales bacterium]
MKKIVFIALLSFLSVQILPAQEVVTQDIKKLPQKAQDFIAKHFSGEKISYIKIDEELLKTDYDVTFVSGKELEFTKDGEWKEVDCKNSAVPSEIIPANILTYVKQNFSNLDITKIEKKSKSYEVELSNNLDLEFDKNGNFLRIDD